jgi:predicted kinase
MLIAMSGLPGAGKSAVADGLGRTLGAPVLSVDPIESALWRAGIARDQPTGYAAYTVADAQCRRLLALGLTVIVDAVNNIAPAQDGWQAVARDLAVRLLVIEVICSDVDVHRDRLARRVRDLPFFREPTWDDVVDRRAEAEPWTIEHLTLDSIDDPATNLAAALAYVSAN